MRRTLNAALLLLAGIMALAATVVVSAPDLLAGPASPAARVPVPTVTTPPITRSPAPTTAPPSPDTPAPPRQDEPAVDAAVDVTLRPGDEGEAVSALQRRLHSLGYWLGQPDGRYANLTEQAVMAFQKVEGLNPDGVAGPVTRHTIDNAGPPRAQSDAGDLVEVDKDRQVLFVVRNGAVAWVLNTSTGTERPYQSGGTTELADTPVGRWQVDRVVDGVRHGSLGALYRPRYFHSDGIAVHGSASVPAYPASHGCVRVTNAAMDWIWSSDLIPLGSTVWIY